MWAGRGSDTAYVAIGRRTYDAIRRHLLHAAVGAALLALCVCCCAIASSAAPAATLKGRHPAKGASSHATSPPAHRRKRHGCARRASFHNVSTPGTKGAKHHTRRSAKCRRHAGRRHASHRRRGARHTAAAPVPQNGVCPNTQLRPSSRDLPLIRTATLCLVNRERLSHGEAALAPNARLETAAQGHSADMAAGDYFEHDGRHGDTPLSRMRASGYIFSSHIGYSVGENIAWATLGLATPKAIVASWMASPGHRANILDATFRETGIGVSPHPLASLARGQSGAIYTQDFGRIIAP
jgi:uncharacterized protein YkwD